MSEHIKSCTALRVMKYIDAVSDNQAKLLLICHNMHANIIDD